MGRRKDIFKTPEYRHIEENLDDILKELEEDEEYKDLTLPDEWDREFREVMENAQKESRKKRKHKQILAAAAVLVVLIGVSGVGLRTKVVQGDGILELFESSVEVGDRRYVGHGTDSGLEFDESDSTERVFLAEDIEELNQQIEEQIKRPFFRLTRIPESIMIKEAVYNTDFNVLNIEFEGKDEKEWFAVSQQTILQHGTKTNVSDKEKIFEVENSYLNQKIEVYRSIKDDLLIFQIEKKNIRLDFTGSLSEDKVKKIAKNIIFE